MLALRTSLQPKQQRCRRLTLISQRKTYTIILKLETLPLGRSMLKLCPNQKEKITDMIFLMLPRFGLTKIIPFLKLVNLSLIETLKTGLLKLNKQLLPHLILFQELKLQTTKCFREDFSHIQMPIDID